jgi:hypothetical protein
MKKRSKKKNKRGTHTQQPKKNRIERKERLYLSVVQKGFDFLRFRLVESCSTLSGTHTHNQVVSEKRKIEEKGEMKRRRRGRERARAQAKGGRYGFVFES